MIVFRQRSLKLRDGTADKASLLLTWARGDLMVSELPLRYSGQNAACHNQERRGRLIRLSRAVRAKPHTRQRICDALCQDQKARNRSTSAGFASDRDNGKYQSMITRGPPFTFSKSKCFFFSSWTSNNKSLYFLRRYLRKRC